MRDLEKILRRLHSLGIAELTTVQALNDLPGSYINLECRLPNGQTAKILDDTKTYLAIQVERTGNERCYGVAADDAQIAVYEYGCNGADAILVAWVRL
ncbi:MAG: hypothetical protein PHT80_06010 [Lentisphaeria bacterium]|nr:hypothetical protein [Lentisphaeria bacterium]